MTFTDDEKRYLAEQRLGRVATTWGINPDAPKHFGGIIERRELSP